MFRNVKFSSLLARAFNPLGLGVVVMALAVAGCKDNTVPGPERGLEYYPVAVNNYWTYAVADSSWSVATVARPSVVTVRNFEFKETITETFTDAAGKPAYRMVRARRDSPTGAWANDSVFTLNATPQSVILNRNNLRTLELIFPVRDGLLWRFNAFNNNSNDTINGVVAETRQYRNVARPFTSRLGAAVQTYPITLTTTDEGPAKEDDLYKIRTYRQVFAKGVGPVFRQRRRFENFYVAGSPSNTFYPGSYFFGYSRTETLTDYGPR